MTVQYLGLHQQENFTETRNLFGRLGLYVKWSDNDRELVRYLADGTPSIIFLSSGEGISVYELTQALALQYPSAAVLLLDRRGEIEIKKAMRAGAADVISLVDDDTRIFSDIQEVQEMLERKASTFRSTATSLPDKNRNARLMAISSAKGGVGKTTLAVNLAAIFAKQEKKVAIADLNLQFGDLPLVLDVKPKRTIYDWVKEEYGRSDGSIEEYMFTDKNGIHVLPSPLRPELAEIITEDHIAQALDELKSKFDVVLIDSGASLDEKLLIALEKSNDIFLMTYLDLPTVKNTKQMLDTFESLALKGKVKIVLNRARKQKGLNEELASKVLGMPISLKLPDMLKVVTAALNEGKPFVQMSPRSKIAKSITAFGSTFYPDEKVSKKTSWKAKKTGLARGHA